MLKGNCFNSKLVKVRATGAWLYMSAGPGSGLDWCLMDIGRDAVMLQLLVLCFS